MENACRKSKKQVSDIGLASSKGISSKDPITESLEVSALFIFGPVVERPLFIPTQLS